MKSPRSPALEHVFSLSPVMAVVIDNDRHGQTSFDRQNRVWLS